MPDNIEFRCPNCGKYTCNNICTHCGTDINKQQIYELIYQGDNTMDVFQKQYYYIKAGEAGCALAFCKLGWYFEKKYLKLIYDKFRGKLDKKYESNYYYEQLKNNYIKAINLDESVYKYFIVENHKAYISKLKEKNDKSDAQVKFVEFLLKYFNAVEQGNFALCEIDSYNNQKILIDDSVLNKKIDEVQKMINDLPEGKCDITIASSKISEINKLLKQNNLDKSKIENISRLNAITELISNDVKRYSEINKFLDEALSNNNDLKYILSLQKTINEKIRTLVFFDNLKVINHQKLNLLNQKLEKINKIEDFIQILDTKASIDDFELNYLKIIDLINNTDYKNIINSIPSYQLFIDKLKQYFETKNKYNPFFDSDHLFMVNKTDVNKVIFSHFTVFDTGEIRLYFVVDTQKKFTLWPSDIVFLKYNEAWSEINKENYSDYKLETEKIIGELKNIITNGNIAQRPTENKEKELNNANSYLAEVKEYVKQLIDNCENDALEKIKNLKAEWKEEIANGYEEDREADGGISLFNNHFQRAYDIDDRIKNIEANNNRKLKKLQEMYNNPFFARFDISLNKEKMFTFYLGGKTIGENMDKHYVESAEGSNPISLAFYYSEFLSNNEDFTIGLKRHFKFSNNVISDYSDEISIYSDDVKTIDEILVSRLNDLNTSTVHDILATIKQKQYEIITYDLLSNLIVNGVAGSGKTMIIMYRILNLISKDSNFDLKSVWMISPNDLFISMNHNFIESKNLDDINNYTYYTTIDTLIKKYCKHNKLIYGLEINNSNVSMSSNSAFFTDEKYIEFEKLVYENIENYAFKEWIVDYINRYLKKYKLNTIDIIDNQIEDVIIKNAKSYITNRSFLNYSINSISMALNILISSSKNKNENIIDLGKYEFFLEFIINHNGGKKLQPNSEFLSDEFKFEQLITIYTVDKIINYVMQNNNENTILLKLYFYMDIFKEKYNLDVNKRYDFENIYFLKSLKKLYGTNNGVEQNYQFVFLDEYQNYSPFEINTLLDAFPKVKLNMFGDINQALEEKGIKTLDELNLQFSKVFELKQNYRNANEITMYVNDRLNMNILPVGVKGVVKEIDSLSSVEMNGTTAIVYKEEKSVLPIINKYSKIINFVPNSLEINLQKINVLPVNLVKGLEFNTVYVIEDDMNKNEKYVAYTRALRNLYIKVCKILD